FGSGARITGRTKRLPTKMWSRAKGVEGRGGRSKWASGHTAAGAGAVAHRPVKPKGQEKRSSAGGGGRAGRGLGARSEGKGGRGPSPLPPASSSGETPYLSAVRHGRRGGVAGGGLSAPASKPCPSSGMSRSV